MKALIVKMSSMGDVIHTLPAVTDAAASISGLEFDWVVEQSYADIAALHPGVDRVLPIELRRWRQSPWKSKGEFAAFCGTLRATRYDVVIDAQGLIKSGIVTRIARGDRVGFDGESAREPVAALAYNRGYPVERSLHAIDRLRRLFAAAFDYPSPETPIDYGLKRRQESANRRHVLLLHGTTWPSKHWPVEYWEELAELVRADGFIPLVTAGNIDELHRASRIAGGPPGQILDRLPLRDLVEHMQQCAGAVSVDTGLGHLAAALDTPMVSVFGPTDPALTGPRGPGVTTLTADHLPCIPCRRRECKFEDRGEPWPPCFGPQTPTRVWRELRDRIE